MATDLLSTFLVVDGRMMMMKKKIEFQKLLIIVICPLSHKIKIKGKLIDTNL